MGSIIDRLEESAIHQDVYIAILSNALQWGNKGLVAQKAGISREYLSRLLREDTNPPSLKVAEHIAKNLPIPLEQQKEFVEHVYLANILIKEASKLPEIARDNDWLYKDAISELLRTHRLASYSGNPRMARFYYRALLQLGTFLINEFNLAKMPLHLAETHILINDVLNVLNRPGDAFYHARMARTVLGALSDHDGEVNYYYDQGGSEQSIDYFDLEINAMRIEAVSFNRYALYSSADLILSQAMESKAVKSRPKAWLSHIIRDKISAMGQDRTANLDDIQRLVKEGYPIHESQDDKLGLLLIHNSLARAYMLRGKYIDAKKILLHELDQTEHFSIGGPLAKTMLLQRLTTLYYLLKDTEAWKHFLKQTLIAAQEGNFTKISRDIAKEYEHEPEYQTILNEVSNRR